MTKQRMFQYAIIWHPTEKQQKEESLKSKVLVEIKTVLAADEKAIGMLAAMEIPAEKKNELDQIEIVVRPF